MRRIFISDIHGEFTLFTELLHEIHYDYSKDQLILLGDYVDRGPYSKDLLQFLIKLKKKAGSLVRTIAGNHDEMFFEALMASVSDNSNEEKSYIIGNFLLNGGTQTLRSYGFSESDTNTEKALKTIVKNNREHIEFLQTLDDYYLDDQFIGVHAGIDPYCKNWQDTDPHKLKWIREEFFNQRLSLQSGHRVIFGHTPVTLLHGRTTPWFQHDKIGIDGGAAYGGALNALIIEDRSFMYKQIKKKAEWMEHSI
ncbi:serine/threonine protein phosphatase [Alkalihalobacillus oceani]|uniref:Serine/threonine protein phosphatase n=1 Tax=Halalkalibacter oceani TaxID=1653776 RepID=A0A9X2IS78_9BACI|nr:metallophosphoesterase family protein [Halalkalibacter oceani]MCM3716258.1 serine/threonine protein phosphatase [Halalkalibacter oceani]